MSEESCSCFIFGIAFSQPSPSQPSKFLMRINVYRLDGCLTLAVSRLNAEPPCQLPSRPVRRSIPAPRSEATTGRNGKRNKQQEMERIEPIDVKHIAKCLPNETKQNEIASRCHNMGLGSLRYRCCIFVSA